MVVNWKFVAVETVRLSEFTPEHSYQANYTGFRYERIGTHYAVCQCNTLNFEGVNPKLPHYITLRGDIILTADERMNREDCMRWVESQVETFPPTGEAYSPSDFSKIHSLGWREAIADGVVPCKYNGFAKNFFDKGWDQIEGLDNIPTGEVSS